MPLQVRVCIVFTGAVVQLAQRPASSLMPVLNEVTGTHSQ
jgi:hypothetical protein